MKLTIAAACTYRRAACSAYSFIRAGEGWDYHQCPCFLPLADGRLMICWWGYDFDECNNDGVLLYSHSEDQGETWDPPQIFIASPNAVVSHLQFARPTEGEALMIYREGHYYGARADHRRRVNLGSVSYAESPMHLLVKRSLDAGFTWEPPTEIVPALVVGRDAPPYYGAPEQLLHLTNGDLLLLVGYLDPDHREPQHYNISVLRSVDAGHTWAKVHDFTVPEERGAMEPSLAEVEPGRLRGVIRNKSGFLYEISASEYGTRWDAPHRTALPTVESMARLLQLASGRLLLVWNNQSSTTQQPRHPLAAALSEDQGRT
ncbi:MAG: sialidase family protein, partial [Candidatus Latescibacterota bacterium]